MIDIHTHILHKVDDGSPSLEASLEMIKHSIDIGVKKIILTPHYTYRKFNADEFSIKSKYDELVTACQKENLDIELALGREIQYTKKVNLISMLKNHQLETLDGTNYILLEFDYEYEVEDLCDILYTFQLNGFKVIIAHVERYAWVTMSHIEDFISEGALLQVNANSLLGKNGLKCMMFTKKLVKKGYVSFIASDVHYFRENNLDKAYAKYGKFLKENPFEKEKVNV